MGAFAAPSWCPACSSGLGADAMRFPHIAGCSGVALLDRRYTADDIRVIPDDPSPCVHCGRPKATSKTGIDNESVCWRKPGMGPGHVCVIGCELYRASHDEKL
jgi:hypothetical protein